MSLNVAYLLSHDEVKQSLNMADSFDDFCYHWDNYELSYVTRTKPTKKIYEALTKAYKSEPIESNYLASWPDKIKRIVERKHAEKINGQWCDMVTANAMLTVLNNLNDTNKEKFM